MTSQNRGKSPWEISKRPREKLVTGQTVDQLLQAQKNDAIVLKVTEMKCQSDILDKVKLNSHSLSLDKEYRIQKVGS